MQAITFNFNLILQKEPHFATHLIENEPCPYHNHTHVEIFYILKGTGKQIINDEEQYLYPGEIVLLRPHDEHKFIDQENSPCTHRDLLFLPKIFKAACDYIGPNVYESYLNADAPVKYLLSNSDVNELNATIKQIELLRYSSPKKAVQLVRLLCVKLIGYTFSSQFKKEPHIPKWLNSLIKEIEDPEKFPVPVADLLKQYYYSEAYIRRIFKKTTGMTPTQLRLNAQLDTVVKMLNDSELSLKDISKACGFNNYTYFYRAFKNRFSTTPRKMLNSDSTAHPKIS